MNDLRVMYGLMTSLQKEVFCYVMTPSGRILESEWIKKVKELISTNNEQKIFNKLKRYYKETCPWLKTNEEAENYTLKCYVSRIWENEEWAGYKEFNELYLGDRKQLSLF